MYLLLLVFGAVLGVAGAVLTIAGVSLRDGSVDAGILTPGTVATVGGVLLIGLGLDYELYSGSSKCWRHGRCRGRCRYRI